MMSLFAAGANLFGVLEVILRVPPLFILDSLLNGTLTVPWVQDDNIKYLGIGFPLFSVYGMLALPTCSVCMLFIFLSASHLLNVYSLLLACGTVVVSYRINLFLSAFLHIDSTQDAHISVVQMFLRVLLSQLALAFCYQRLLNGSHLTLMSTDSVTARIWQSTINISALFVLPGILLISLRHVLLCSAVPLTCAIITFTHLFIAIIVDLISIVSLLGRQLKTAHESMVAYGLTTFIESEWSRLRVPWMLRAFWLFRCAFHLAYFIWQDSVNTESIAVSEDQLSHTLVHGCETVLSVLGLTSCVSYVMHLSGSALFTLAGYVARDDDREIATTTAVLFFILALQTGLTGLDDTHRLIRLYRNLFLLCMASCHFIHTGLHRHLISLAATVTDLSLEQQHRMTSTVILRHARVIAVLLCLAIFAVTFTLYLWSSNAIGTWLLAVTAFALELVVKTTITMATYGLFVRSGDAGDLLDDRVYVLQSVGSTIEFLFGIFLFCNGMWIMMYESRGYVRAFMMCMHAYFNIIVQAREGWNTFIKRRTASMKINRLSIVTDQDVTDYADVCAICYQELRAGSGSRKTQCKHIFHGACLRRWLYIQDQCPLCHQNIYSDESSHSVHTETVGRGNI